MNSVNHNYQTQDSFGRFLVQNDIVIEADLERANNAKQNTQTPIHLILESLGISPEQTLLSALAEHLDIPIIEKSDFPSALDFNDKLEISFLKRNRVYPVKEDPNSITIATVNPFDKTLVPALAFHLEKPVSIMLASSRDIDTALEAIKLDPVETPETSLTLSHHDIETLKNLATEQPVIKFVNKLIEDAVELRVSDIHIEPEHLGFKTRFRVDGILTLRDIKTSLSHAAIASRIKIMANLNIAERRLPQDGRIRMAVRGNSIDLRISTIPTFHGESIVLRVLDKSAVSLDFSSLGYDGSALTVFQNMLAQPNGIILVTGPTGSGKTTTLYTALKSLNNGQKKIFTVEDPVEYQLPGINQIPTQPAIGLDFAKALRSILRQDPDIIMIGEIRDLETAQIAIQAALTGHLVLATLHTNSSAAAITRLLDMGVQDFLLSSTLTGVVAQRLVRHLCKDCSIEDDQASRDILIGLYPDIVNHNGTFSARKHTGCSNCNQTGYKGRSSIFEVMPLTRDIKRAIIDNPDEATLQSLAQRAGMDTMLDMGLNKVASGQTTLEEVLRVTKSN